MPRRPVFNSYRVAGDTAYLELTNRKGEVIAEALVDAADLPLLKEYGRRWCHVRKKGGGASYALSSRPSVLLHRLLLPDAEVVDHINGNGLDNRRANLRPCTTSENLCNRAKTRSSTTGYKGAYWHKATGRWQAVIGKAGKLHHIGLFDTVEQAARAYDRAARELHGEFAKLNFPDHQPQPALLEGVA